mmetsp:Transcript_31242/g.72860  ORF Transcript_31242/g.72860 Transcript_31242/m.72860 type:complete len:281 (+) Transcript_31242:60-902(+)
MGLCLCVPNTTGIPTDAAREAILNSSSGEGRLQIMRLDDWDACLDVNARALCGTADADGEATGNWCLGHSGIEDINNPERLSVFRWYASMGMYLNWQHTESGFCVGGFDEGALGAACTVVPMPRGYKATEGFITETVLPAVLNFKLVAAGKAPTCLTKKDDDWRKGFFAKGTGENGLFAMQKKGHGKYFPDTAHFYIALMMVKPDLQGKGLCSLVMRAVCRAADALGWPVFLETGGLRNVAVYKRFGFKVLEQCSLSAPGYDSYDEVYLMARDAVKEGWK